MKKLVLTALLAWSTAHADQELDELKQSFAGAIQKATQEFERASQMNVNNLPKGEEISKSQCEEIKNRIRRSYRIDPFDFAYEHGSVTSAMCGGQYGYLKNFTLQASGNTNMGLPYVMVVQLEGDDSWKTMSHWFIDSNDRIVEKQTISRWPETGEILKYGITSVNSLGNVYLSSWTKNFSIANTDVEGTETIQRFIPVDGSSPYPLLRRSVKHKTDSSKDYGILGLTRSDKQDWDAFELPITHAWAGGFYKYAGKYFSTPRFKSGLTIKYRGGKEVCAFGTITKQEDWSRYPVQDKPYYDCVNY